MLKETDKIFLFKWFSSLFTVWYASIGLYLYDPYILQIIYWPLHTHDIEIDVVESTVDWQSYIDKLDRDLEIGYMYPPPIDDSEPETIEEIEDGKVVCEDDNGKYITYANRLDNGLADPRRSAKDRMMENG